MGKTTLQEQLIDHLTRDLGVEPNRILRVQFDEIPGTSELADPILAVARWFERTTLGRTFNEAAHEGKPAYLFLDEVQNLEAWAPQVKALVDTWAVRALVTGSSALRMELGQDSLAGRVSPLELGPLYVREIAELRHHVRLDPFLPLNGLGPLLEFGFWKDLRVPGPSWRDARDLAFRSFSARGGYPIAQVRADRPWEEVAEQLNDVVVKRAIGHDLRVGMRGRKRDAALLEEVFRLACRYAGQAPGQGLYVSEVKASLHANIGWARILQYFRFLESALLLRLIPPLELRLKRQKGTPKIALCDPALRAAWSQEFVPLDPESLAAAPHLSDLAGHLAESVLGYFLGGIPGLQIAHFPSRGIEREVDFVLTVGDRRIPIEVKYRKVVDSHRDTEGLRAFLEKTAYNAPFGILVALTDGVEVLDPRIVALPLSTFLLLR